MAATRALFRTVLRPVCAPLTAPGPLAARALGTAGGNPVEYPLGPHRSNAEELINAVPVIKATCNGGGGALGHPIEYIQLNTVVPGEAVTCKYCGLRYASDGSH